MIMDEIKSVLKTSYSWGRIKDILKYSAIIVLVVALVSFVDGHSFSMPLSEYATILAVILLVIFVLYTIYVLLRIIAVLDYAQMSGKPGEQDAVEKTFSMSLAGLWWLLAWVLKLAFIALAIYGLYFVFGGIIGLLKFGWKNM